MRDHKLTISRLEGFLFSPDMFIIVNQVELKKITILTNKTALDILVLISESSQDLPRIAKTYDLNIVLLKNIICEP